MIEVNSSESPIRPRVRASLLLIVLLFVAIVAIPVVILLLVSGNAVVAAIGGLVFLYIAPNLGIRWLSETLSKFANQRQWGPNIFFIDTSDE